MKKKLKLILSIATISFFFGCSSSNDENINQNSTPTILLSKVINKIPNDPGYNKPALELFYEGKKLVSLKSYGYTNLYNVTPFITTDTFNYDSNGKLTSVNSSHIYPNNYSGPTSGIYITNSTITYNGNNIANIKTYKNNILFQEYSFTYNGDKLTSINIGGNTYNYVFDANGNILENGRTYDSKKGIINTLPFWQYFYTQQHLNTSTVNNQNTGIVNGIIYILPSSNNLLSYNFPTPNQGAIYTYQYNENGYPTNSTISYSGITQDYSYEYITAN